MEAALITAAISAAGQAVSAIGSAKAANAQAASDQQRADMNARWAERRALEERASAQRAAGDELRTARLAQSRLTALAGASGAGASDPTIMDLWGDIEQEGRYNAAMAMASGDQKASGLTYQADLDRWTAAQNARIQRQAAKTSLIAGLMGAGGTLAGGMAKRYGSAKSNTYGTGYGYYG